MDQAFFGEFASPGSAYRGKPFWAWNGRLQPQELRRQVRLMHRMGLGGFFMHSRVGLDTAYLSDEWFECVAACIDEAERLGMEAWLYDEDRWPSGAAGGLVTKNPKYRMRSLVLTVLDKPKDLAWDKDTLAAFTARVDGSTATDVTRLAKGKRPRRLAKGHSILVFRVLLTPCSSWYNGYTYLDTMSEEAVAKFIEVTHEAYRARCGEHFGKLVPGIFTDEPHHGSAFQNIQGTSQGIAVPWTPKLRAVFKQRYGYDLIPHLPKLFFDVDGQPITPPRAHYHDCITHLYVDSFARQIGAWCGRHGLQFTGHVLMEDSLSAQTGVVGSCMRFYEHMQAPGMDLLTEHNREYDTAKQVASAARQFGRTWRLSETYGCTGWDFSFAGHKAVGDWQTALGINLRCHHLAWYTMEGQAKRDYPAAIGYQSPWWHLYRRVEDYYARLHVALTRGTEVRDLLVIHPVESMWTLCRVGWTGDPAVHALDQMLVDLRDSLLAANLDFDYGDEELLARHAKVSRKGGGPTLKVGKAVYKAVVVPPLRTVRSSTVRLLARFHKAGGTVVFAGDVAEYVDAVPSDAAAKLAAHCPSAPAKGRALVGAVEPTCRRVSIADAKGREIGDTLHLLREDGQAYTLFVCNASNRFEQGRLGPADLPARKRTVPHPDVWIRGFADCHGAPLELDPNTGDAFAAEASRGEDGWTIRTGLPPLGSRLFLIPKGAAAPAFPKRRPLRNVRVRSLNTGRWDIVLSEANNLVLDRPDFRIGSGAWRGPEEILRVDHLVRDALGLPRRGGQMVQPWARERPAAPRAIPVALIYRFDAKALPTGDFFLALERPGSFRADLNGTPLDTDADCGWWVDRSLRKLPVDPALVRIGANELILECDYSERHPGLEIVYLLGTFGTHVEGTDVALTYAPTLLRLGNWVPQGLAFYSGSVSYLRTIRPRLQAGERLFVAVPRYAGAAVRILVSGEVAGIIGWPPNEVDITDFIAGPNLDLRIEVIGHRRNSHGPLHLAQLYPHAIGPGHFTTAGDAWTDGYTLVPCGLMAPPRLIVRK